MSFLVRVKVERERRRRRSSGEGSKWGKYHEFQQKYFSDPAGFVDDCIKFNRSDGPTPYQRETLQKLTVEKRVSLRGPHGLGKTALAAWVVLWFALTRDGRDWKAPTTATAWRQLTKYLWPEVRKWARRLDWDKIGRAAFDERRELLTLSLKLSTGESFALASSDASAIEGAHANHLLYLFDEARAIPDQIWDGAEGAFASPGTAEAFALAISTPGEPQGRFYDIHSRKAGYEDWYARHITLREAIEAKRIDQAWADQRKAQWGEDSAVYQNRVLGEFAASSDEGVIPLAWVERSNQRWLQWQDEGAVLPVQEITSIGVDVARSGMDQTVYALRYDKLISELRRYSKQDTMKTAGQLSALLTQGGIAIVDVIGVGAGVVDRLMEQGKQVLPFNAAERTEQMDRSGLFGFADVRSAAWWNLRQLLEDDEIMLPPDDLLTGDLTSPHWTVVSGGKIKVESKKEIRQRLNRSTDSADAVIAAFWRDRRRIFLG